MINHRRCPKVPSSPLKYGARNNKLARRPCGQYTRHSTTEYTTKIGTHRKYQRTNTDMNPLVPKHVTQVRMVLNETQRRPLSPRPKCRKKNDIDPSHDGQSAEAKTTPIRPIKSDAARKHVRSLQNQPPLFHNTRTTRFSCRIVRNPGLSQPVK